MLKENIMGSLSESQTAIDRISILPNNLIAHILSFLSTEEAVRTSTLATHWNEHWTLTSNLDFDDGLLIEENSRCKTNESALRFVNFVYRVLLYKVTRLDLFRIKCAHRDYGVQNVSQWLSIALSRDVREIDLVVPLVGRCLEYTQLFSSKTLVILTLGLGFLLKVPKTISLESLKVLHLNYIQFEDGESLTRLVKSCVLLRELKIEGELCETVNVLYISSPVLKSLILIHLYSLRESNIHGAHAYKIVLNTPNLRYFEHNDVGVPDGYHIESTLNCLDEAWLSLELSWFQFGEYDDQLVLARSMQDLALAIFNVRFLFLSEMAFDAFCSDCALPDFQLPIFPRLINLDIGSLDVGVMNQGARLLTAFLQSSPQLASLYYKLDYEPEFWDPPTDVPSCMLYNLKVIGVDYYGDEEPGLGILKYLLEKTNCLEEVTITWSRENNAELIDKISLLPRASNACKIVHD